MIGRHLAIEPMIADQPKHWSVARFKAVFDRLDDRNVDLSEPMMSLKSSGHVVPRASLGQRQEPDESSLPRYRLTCPGDLVVNPMWLVGGAIGISDVSGAVSPDYRVFRPRQHHPRYLHYLLRMNLFVDQYRLYTRAQTTFDRRVQQPDLDNLPLPVPPIAEQGAIAGFLDHETAQIDTLIAKQEQLIATLRERRVSVVELAIGSLDWTAPLRSAVSLVQTGPFGSQLKSDEYEPGGTPVINPSHIVAGRISPDSGVAVATRKAADLSRHAFNLGDLVMGRRGELGRCAVVTPEAVGYLCGTGSALVRPRPDRLDAAFLALVYGTRRNRDALALVSVGSTMDNVNADIIAALRVPLPPVAEQQKIVTDLEEQTRTIDTLIAKTERFIELSKERRTALITAAVTGQIDVRKSA